MVMSIDTVIENKRKRVAADYRRRGYRVTQPARSEALPSFLRDCHPDLIAERDDDHVVIEIKPSRALKNSNDLEELAARVAAQPGWRFELVALGGAGDEGEIVSLPDWLESMLRKHDLAAGPNQAYFQVIYLGQILEFLVRGVALKYGIGTRDKLAGRIARELAFAGVIGQPTLDRVESALNFRNQLLYEGAAPEEQAEQVTEMTTLCRDVYAESLGAARRRFTEA